MPGGRASKPFQTVTPLGGFVGYPFSLDIGQSRVVGSPRVGAHDRTRYRFLFAGAGSYAA
jgi:hypothetical protein